LGERKKEQRTKAIQKKQTKEEPAIYKERNKRKVPHDVKKNRKDYEV
jgi:hypothetical protein